MDITDNFALPINQQMPLQLLPSKTKLNQCVLNWYNYSETGNITELNKITETSFSSATWDIALRKWIYKFENSNPNYIECAKKLLWQNLDINFQNQNDNNSTIWMTICGKGELALVKAILESPREEPGLPPVERKKKKLDIEITDKANCTFLHYICYQNANEDDALEILNYFLNDYCKDGAAKASWLKWIEVKDTKGNVPLSICLMKGWSRLVTRLINIISYKQNINNLSNNFLHCAVIGKSLLCVQISWYYSNPEDFKLKNKDNMTPIQIANKKGYFFVARVIDDYEANINYDIYKKTFSYFDQRNKPKPIDILSMFANGEYEIVLCFWSQYKLSQSIKISHNSNTKATAELDEGLSWTNLSVDWNILWTKHKISLSKHNKHNKSASVPSNSTFTKFFDKYFSTNVIQNTHPKVNWFANKYLPLDIIVYNKGIYHLQNGEIMDAVATFSLYISKVWENYDNAYYKWIIYVNVSFLLIEWFVRLDLNDIANLIIESLGQFLFTSWQLKSDSQYTADIDKIYLYLNEIDVLNQFTPEWDESFCYWTLWNLMNAQEKKHKWFKDYKRTEKKCKYIKEMKIFKTMKLLYLVWKIQKYYGWNHMKAMKKLAQFSIAITELDNQKWSNEYKIYYYNMLGICNLKIKNYNFAELQFKKCLNVYKEVLANNAKEKNTDIKTEYILSIKYNIALCWFLQKRYKQARDIFLILARNKQFNGNSYLWYRIGLCNWELAIEYTNKKKEVNNDVIQSIKGYKLYTCSNSAREGNKREATADKDGDCISIDLNEEKGDNADDDDSNNAYDELYKQFEKEYGTGVKKSKISWMTTTQSSITTSTSGSTALKSKLNTQCAGQDTRAKGQSKQQISTQFNPILKEKIFNYANKRMLLFSKYTSHNHNKTYWTEAVIAFKQVLLIVSSSSFSENSSIKSIVNFYSKTLKINQPQKPLSSAFYTINTSTALKNIWINTYWNWFFTYSWLKEWNLILFYCYEFNRRNYPVSKDMKIKIEFFHIEAWINWNRWAEAEKLIKERLKTMNGNNDNFKVDVYNKSNWLIYNDTSFKWNWTFGWIWINIKNRKIKEAEASLEEILKKTSKNLPSYVVNLLIYINLYKINNWKDMDNEEKYKKEILSLLKYRKRYLVNNNNNIILKEQ